VLAHVSRNERSPGLAIVLATGVLGGFTAFATVSPEVASLWERGRTLAAAAYVAASLLIGVDALFVGMWAIRCSASDWVPDTLAGALGCRKLPAECAPAADRSDS
jgi:fluoride ion exporter CrcB/FEX